MDIARILQHSEARDDDLRTLLKAQLLFWLLAATDGHAKNFSIFLLAGGRYRLTPLYDVLSAWPVTGPGPNHLDYEKLRLAMALRGKNTHDRLRDIQRRHFNDTAQKCGLGPDMETVIDEVLSRVAGALEEVGRNLPPGFPEELFTVVAEGIRTAAARI